MVILVLGSQDKHVAPLQQLSFNIENWLMLTCSYQSSKQIFFALFFFINSKHGRESYSESQVGWSIWPTGWKGAALPDCCRVWLGEKLFYLQTGAEKFWNSGAFIKYKMVCNSENFQYVFMKYISEYVNSILINMISLLVIRYNGKLY